MNQKLSGGLSACHEITQRLVDTNPEGVANYKSQAPMSSGIIQDAKHDYSVKSSNDYIKPLGIPNWDKGAYVNTQNAVIEFQGPQGSVFLNASNIQHILDISVEVTDALKTIDDLINNWHYIPDGE